MNLDQKSEKLFIRFMNPTEVLLPSEIHELARSLLDAYRKQTEDAYLQGEFPFFSFMSEIIKRYYLYIEEIVIKRRVTVREKRDILKWWKELIAVPSIQGILLATSHAEATPVLKLAIATGYFVKQKWNKRSLRKLIEALSQEISKGKSIREFSEQIRSYEYRLFRKVVGSAEPEVDELALLLEEARNRIYWQVETAED